MVLRNPSQKLSPDEQLADDLAKFYADPLGFVMYVFPWDTDKSIQLVKLPEKYRARFGCEYGPDAWACEFLDELGQEIRKRGFDGEHAVDPIQFATTSGHGIGKSVMVAWLVMFIMATRPFAKGVVTANTAEQLRTKTWAEVGKWHKLSLVEHWFRYNTGRGAMSLVRIGHEQTWRCDAQTSREENSEAFAGLHAANSTPFYIFDESSAVPDKIFEVREGGTTDGEPMVFDFGNPTRNSGRLFEECQGKLKHRYIVRCIDSRSVAITNKKRLQEWIDDYGIDSDFVKVRVLGQFPSAGNLQFIPTDDVKAAQTREAVLDRTSPLLIGVDVARFGDDETVIYPRVGADARSWPPRRFKGLDTVSTVGKVIETIRDFRQLGLPCSGLFVDGGGVGGGVVDQLRALGYTVHEVQFGGSPTDKNTYRFKVDEMWGRMRDWIKARGALPAENTRDGSKLFQELTQREFAYTLKTQINLESKSDMKERLGNDFGSPNIADALACTFAEEVAPLAMDELGFEPGKVECEYDPLEAKW